MEKTKIVISKGKTTNLGNYESKRVDVSLEARLAPGDNFDECYAQVSSEVTALLAKEH